ncbi:MAG: DUF1127 domain-containing protein [Silicimonas sp.]|nr:DUF1127 domain-containing protein [Silicimonas sp.]NND17047.1 DUF1127 domain-containing protein [Silicimonas sp.]RZW01930.1 MAG: DUF1127 domain-containing protein [Paracoccaceae bacterium]
MSMINEVNKAHRGTDNGLTGFLGGLTTRFAQYRTYRRTLDELERLSDRELADLGISRLGLRSIAYRAAYDG